LGVRFHFKPRLHRPGRGIGRAVNTFCGLGREADLGVIMGSDFGREPITACNAASRINHNSFDSAHFGAWKNGTVGPLLSQILQARLTVTARDRTDIQRPPRALKNDVSV
jgi:hypothetical protein